MDFVILYPHDLPAIYYPDNSSQSNEGISVLCIERANKEIEELKTFSSIIENGKKNEFTDLDTIYKYLLLMQNLANTTNTKIMVTLPFVCD